MRIGYILLFVLGFGIKLHSQYDSSTVQSKIDEAREVLTSNPKKSLIIAFQANKLAIALGNKRLIAFSLNTIGSAYSYVASQDSTIFYHQKALDIQRSINDDLGAGRSLTNMGITFSEYGQNDKAINCFLEAEQKFINVKFDIGLSKLYNSMGALFNNIKDYNNSILYYKKGIAIADKLGDSVLSYSLKMNLANLYGDLNMSNEALALYKESYEVIKADSNYSDLLVVCNNICQECLKIKNYAVAKYYNNEALLIIKSHEVENYLKTTSYSNHAEILASDGKFAEAVLFVDSALNMLKYLPDLGREIGLKYQLGKLLYKSGNYSRSYEVLIDALNLKDTLYTKNLREKLSEINTIHEVDKKETQIQQLSDAQKQQRKINYLLVGVAVISFIAIVILISSYRRKKKDNEIIQLQKDDVINKSKLIEEKQNEILDSINYARRIQYSLLASDTLLNENLKNYFLLFKPKDVVSGDFYWGTKTVNDCFVLITADSTGHGVPGAIMSILNISCLNEVINSDRYMEPADILNETRKKVISHLANDGSEDGGKDGMDCSVCVFDFNNKILKVSAANNPVWIVRSGGELIEIKPDKMPVGKHDKQDISFSQHQIQLQAGDIIYTLTDGFPDQFGGEKGKKFMSKNLREYLISISHLPMHDQKQLIESTFNKWKGNLEQVDDVTVIGIRI